MFKIGEFSKLTKVSIRMLRYYDEMDILKPESVDNYTGYRMYSANQIPYLQKILLLRDAKFNIIEIKNIINQTNEYDIFQKLEDKKIQIQKEIDQEKNRIKLIDTTIDELKRDRLKIHCNINFKSVDKMIILSTRDIIPTYFDEGILWERLCKYIDKEGINIKSGMYNNVAIYHDIEHKDKNVDVEVGLAVNKIYKSDRMFICREVESASNMAYAMVYGPYSNLAKAYEMLAYYLEEHNSIMDDKPSRQICHIGVDDTKNPEEYLTEIQIPLK